MKIEILFHTSSSPKTLKKVAAVYTKDALLCIQLKSGLIIKYPLLNIFSVCHMHGQHLGTSCKKRKKK